MSKAIVQKYGFADTLLLEEIERGILLRKQEDLKLSWEETYKAMAQEREAWEDFDPTIVDGLEEEDEFDPEAL